MKRPIIWTLIALLLLAASPLHAEVVNRIVAVVNDEIITAFQLDQEVAKRFPDMPKLSGPELFNQRKQVLAELVEQTLLRQRTKALGLSVSQEDLEGALEDVQKQNNLNREQLKQALAAQGMKFEDYLDNLRNQILRLKLIGREVQSKVEVTNQETREYFREHIDDYRLAPFVRLSRISFPFPANSSVTDQRSLRFQAEDALHRLQSGEDFNSVLALYTSEKVADGGSMGTFAKGELTPQFEQAITGLETGQVSSLLETPQGYHILRVDERSSGGFRKYDQVKGEIEETLRKQKTEEGFKEWTENLKKDSYIDIRL